MKHFFFAGHEKLEPDEIKRILLDNCEGSETKTYTKQLTKAELDELNESYVAVDIEIDKLKEDLKAAKDKYKEAVTPLLKDNIKTRKTLKTKHQEIEGIVYRIPDHDKGVMDFVNVEGEIVDSRRLKPEERQARMFPINKAVNQ